MIGLVTYVTLLERKFAARMQSRIGPYYVGWPHGWLQPIADALKLMMKEDIVPTAGRPLRSTTWRRSSSWSRACLIFATIPFAPGLGVADLNIGVLFFLAVSSLEIVGLFMGGWGSNNKYALLSAMRAVNQIISYDLPFVFAALVPVVLAGSLQMSAIVAAQQGLWFVAYPVIGQLAFVAFLVATLAAENRVPFDILEAESELVAGFRVEYSGMKFALIQLAEYAHMIGTSLPGRAAVPGRLAGAGPGVARPALVPAQGHGRSSCVVTWVRWSFVRIRVDQILAISWKLLLPATSLVLLLATGFVVARDAEVPVSPDADGVPRRDRRSSWAPSGRAMGVTLRNLFRKPVTVHYPDGPAAYPDRFRGILALAYEKETGEEACIGCRLCEYDLPAAGHQGRDAEGGEAELRQDLHARALLRASSASCACRCARPTPSS